MKIFCLLPVRDEEDIIKQCLDHLVTWADKIFIFDTGSIDSTWEIIQDYASGNSKVKPLAKDQVYYSETKLRGYIFNKAREEMKDGDWFVRVDADEFHYISPIAFIKERLQRHETIVYHQYYNFELTQREMTLLSTYEAIRKEREKPIQERRRYYRASLYSEPRLCKYRSTMQWPPSVSFPYNAGFVAKERLPILHYPNRDPLQMERRCKLRALMLADEQNKLNWSGVKNMHWTISDWKKFIVDDNDSELQWWKPGTVLDEVRQLNHLAPFYKRVPQRIIHTFFLRLIDQTRSGYPEETYPQKIDPVVVKMLESALSEDTFQLTIG